MIKLKLKDKKNYYDIKIKGKNYNLIQYISLLDIIIRNIRKDYNMNMKIRKIIFLQLKYIYQKVIN